MTRNVFPHLDKRCFLFFLSFAFCASLITWYEMVSHSEAACSSCYRKLAADDTTFHRKVSRLSAGNFNSNQNLHDEPGRDGCYVYTKGRLALARTEVNTSLREQLKCAKQKPSVAILGVKKCGTETLTGMLDLHPNIVTNMYPVQNGCCMDLDRRAFDRVIPFTVPDELALLNMIGLQYAPENISSVLEFMSENPKFIVILKDPMQRALSDYIHVTVKMNAAKGKALTSSKREQVWNYVRNQAGRHLEKVSYFKGYRVAANFEKTIINASGIVDASNKLISLGRYDVYIDTIFRQVQRDSVLFVDGETFMDKPWVVLKEIESFLGVSSYFVKRYFQKENGYYCAVIKERPDSGCLKGKGRSKPNIDKNVLKMLNKYYRRRNHIIVTLTGKRFSWM